MAKRHDEELQLALDTCAAEPVHIPGTIQPFANLLACDPETRKITHASANMEDAIGLRLDAVLGADMRDILGRRAWHNITGALQAATTSGHPIAIGAHDFPGGLQMLSVFPSADAIVVELEAQSQQTLATMDALRTLDFLNAEITACKTENDLFALATETLRHITGYDRALLYKFDPDFNGEILAESRSPRMESYLGLRFPHWDIPAQARAIMARIPLRIISDVEQDPLPLICAPDSRALDLTPAISRGVSAVHMDYLRNMGLGATMSVTLKHADELWGMIAFHHRRPRVPEPGLRAVLKGFAQSFALKLELLAAEKLNIISAKTDEHALELLQRFDKSPSVDAFFEQIAPELCKALKAQGLSILNGDAVTAYGTCPGPSVLEALATEAAKMGSGAMLAVQDLSAHLADLSSQLGPVAGAMVLPLRQNQTLIIFRDAVNQTVHWAGNPEKTIDRSDGRIRLAPRGSFSAYLQEVEGQCQPWTVADRIFARRFGMLLMAITSGPQ